MAGHRRQQHRHAGGAGRRWSRNPLVEKKNKLQMGWVAGRASTMCTHLDTLQELHDQRQLADVAAVVYAQRVRVAEVAVPVEHRPTTIRVRLPYEVHLVHG